MQSQTEKLHTEKSHTNMKHQKTTSRWNLFAFSLALAVFSFDGQLLHANEVDFSRTQQQQLILKMVAASSRPYSVQNSSQKYSARTIGGRQFWGDVEFFHGWKIQQNIFSQKYRLLDPEFRRHQFGTLKQCQDYLARVRQVKNLQPMSGKCIVLVHGMGCSSSVFRHHRQIFEKQGYTIIPFEYPSTRVKIEDSAEYLNRVIQSLEGITEINVIAHSMGGLVLRAWSAKHQDPRMHRLVMMGTPNKGAKLASLFKNVTLFRLAFGPAGQQMATLAQKGTALASKFPIPTMEFAIIAGGKNNAKGYNALIPGDDDGTVAVESTRLSGAKDFRQVNCLHSRLVNDYEVLRLCQNFLLTGQLDTKAPIQPIH